MISRRKVWKRVAIGWGHTILVLIVSYIIILIASAIACKLIGPKMVVSILVGSYATSLLIYILSEVIITMIFQAEKPDPEKHKEFIKHVESLCQERGIIFGKVRFLWPRIYILKSSLFKDKPNAMAFGMSIFGQHAIGISESLYNLLDSDELKAVVAHELAHIRCRDVGMMSTLSIATSGAEQLSALCWKAKGVYGPAAIFGVVLLYIFAKLMLPVSRSVMMQERERSADALSTLYCGTSEHLISALRKLDATRYPEEKKGFLTDLFITHPHTERRIEDLESLTLSKENLP